MSFAMLAREVRSTHRGFFLESSIKPIESRLFKIPSPEGRFSQSCPQIKNIERNPKVSLVLESGGTRQDIKGVMIQGKATVYADPENILRLSREAARRRGVAENDFPSEPRPGAAYIRVQPKHVISWDYGRETDDA